MADVKKATLYWPNWQMKVVVVGSTEASQLQSQWWWLKPWSYKEPSSVTAQNSVDYLSSAIQDIWKKYWLDDAWISALSYMARDLSSNQKTVISPEKADEYLQSAIAEANVDLEPYYKEKTAEELSAYKQSLANLRNEAARYSQQEALSYAQKLQQTKDNLRQRWLTFSWVNRKTLWAAGSMENLWIEWTVPMKRRYDWEDTRANWQERANTLWSAAEKNLGSSAISSVDSWQLPDPYWTRSGSTDLTYDPSRMQPLYLSRKVWQEWYRSIWDLEKEKMTELEKSAQSRFTRKLQYLQ